MTRLPSFGPSDLDPDARALYEKIIEGPRGTSMLDERGGLAGPFNAMLLSPVVGDALQELGAAIRYRSALSDRSREIAILVVAHHWDCSFEQRVHEELGRRLGLTGDQLDALRTGAPLELPDPEEAAVLRLTRALVARADLDDEEYPCLPEQAVFELTTLVGYYATLALQLRVFRV